jgi:hypothetical protein
MYEQSRMNLTWKESGDPCNGVVRFSGDQRAKVWGYVNKGWIKAYGGRGQPDVTAAYVDRVWTDLTQTPPAIQTNSVVDVTTLSAGTAPTDADLGRAWNPRPANPTHGDVPLSGTVLSWNAGDFAQSVNGHRVYFGTDFVAVSHAVPGSAEDMGLQSETNYSTGVLSADMDYFWRIDEVNDSDPASPWKGDIWKFTTRAATVLSTASPVRPDETALIQGAAFGSDPAVQMARLSDAGIGVPPAGAPAVMSWTDADAVQGNAQSVKAVVPATWNHGVYTVRVKNTTGLWSEPALINTPQIWWAQGDEGETASPGGWIRVFGMSIDLNNDGSLADGIQIALVQNGTAACLLSAAEATEYDAAFDLPAELLPGTYELYFHNGYGGNAGWARCDTLDARSLTVSLPVAWPSTIFDLSAYTAGSNDTDRLNAALADAQTNGGGVVFLPAGSYALTGRFTVPDRTVLRGAGTNETVLSWISWTPSGVSSTMITGSCYAIEAMSILLPNNYTNGITAGTGFRMERTQVHTENWTIDTPRNRGALLELSRAGSFRVIDCDLLAKQETIRVEGARYGLISGNRLAANGANIQFSNAARMICESNTFRSLDTLWAFGGSRSVSRFLYYANNTSDDTFTFDSSHGVYFGHVAAVNGTELTLAGSTNYSWAGTVDSFWTGGGGAVVIADGHGAGQWRWTTGRSSDGKIWTVDRPWDVEPDSTSVITIVTFQGRLLLVDNVWEKTTTTEPDRGFMLWAYYMSADVTFARNRISGYSHLTACGGGHFQGVMPALNFQCLDNEVLAQAWNSTGGYSSTLSCSGHSPQVVLGGSNMEDHGIDFTWYTGPTARGAIFRRNIDRTPTRDTKIEISQAVTDAVVERNTVNDSGKIVIYGTVINAWPRDNVYRATMPSIPVPADGTGGVSAAPSMSWEAPVTATGSRIYIARSWSAVNDRSAAALRGEQPGTTFDPGALKSAADYFWAVDSVDGSGATTPGAVWRFTTGRVPGGDPDSDADGIPDWWEQEYYGGITNAPATIEKLGRNVPAYSVYAWGADPHDPADGLRLTPLAAQPSGKYGFSFIPAAERIYDVLTATNLLEVSQHGWQTSAVPGHTGITGSDEPIVIEQETGPAQRFFKLRVRPAE